MENAGTIPPQTIASTQSRRLISPAGLAVALLLGGLWFVLCRSLSIEWSGNDQYSYGWFVPFFAAYLFWLRWEDRPQGAGGLDGSAAHGSGPRGGELDDQDRPAAGSRRHSAAVCVLGFAAALLLLLLPIRAFEVVAPDWRPLTWLHALLVVTLTLVVVWRAGGIAWVRHFAFPIAFILVAVPWIAAIEVTVVQGLMRIVAAIAAEALAIAGVPAQLEGNLLRLRTGLVGVNEACSGVRSLQTSLMIGLLFGELNRLSVPRRLGLLATAAAIALLGNVCRAFFLVWVAAHDGIDATERWHDLTGYAIVGIVFGGSMAAATLLARRKTGPRADAPEANARKEQRPAARSPLPIWAAVAACVWVVAVEAAVEAWYRYHEQGLVERQRWTVNWPEAARNFREVKLDEGMQGILRFDEGRGATWLVQRTSGESEVANAANTTVSPTSPLTCVLYFFRWNAGRSSILRARGHRPDICLPSVGWTQSGDHGMRGYAAGNLSLPFRHFEFTRSRSASQSPVTAHAFFCVAEESARPGTEASETEKEINERQGLSLVPQLWRLVRSGERPRGQQVLQLIFVSPQQLPAEAAQAEFAQLVDSLVVAEPARPEA